MGLNVASHHHGGTLARGVTCGLVRIFCRAKRFCPIPGCVDAFSPSQLLSPPRNAALLSIIFLASNNSVSIHIIMSLLRNSSSAINSHKPSHIYRTRRVIGQFRYAAVSNGITQEATKAGNHRQSPHHWLYVCAQPPWLPITFELSKDGG
jgi:hypothetical protein